MGVRGDLLLMERAVRNRWLTEDLKPKVLECLVEILETGGPRERLRASQTIVAMEGQNQKDEHKEQDNFPERVYAIAARLGIDTSIVEGVATAIEGTGVSDEGTDDYDDNDGSGQGCEAEE